MALKKILENKNICSVLYSVDYIKETREMLGSAYNWVGL